jgi:predicted RecA/RadA family phage recombinase
MAAYYHSTGTHLDYTPVSAVSAGTLVTVANTTGIVNNDIAANELGAVCIRGTVRIDKASATVFAAGDAVNYNESTKLAVTTAIGAGVIAGGRAVTAAPSGTLEVVVLLPS